MATPLRRPINEEFSDRYDRNTGFESSVDNSNSATNTNRGIQNARAVVGNTLTKSGNRLMAQGNEIETRARLRRSERRGRLADATAAAEEKIGKQMTRLGKYGRVGGRAILTGRGTTGSLQKINAKVQAAIIFTWTGFLWSIQGLLASFSLIGLGGAFVFNASGFVGEMVNGVLQWVTEIYLGFKMVDLQVIFMIPYFLIILIGFLSFAFAALQFKLAGIHPFFGETGAGWKQTAAIIAFFGYFIPGINFLPLVWLWVWAVRTYPN